MKKLVIITALLFTCLHLFGQEIAIRNVNVIDVESGKVSKNYGVLIANGKISWIGPDKKMKFREGTQVVDATGKYLMPGLIDGHIHFFQSGSLYTRPDVVDLTAQMSYQEERENGFNNSIDYLKRYLRLGITTVVDVGGPFNNFVIRDSISKTIASPNVLVTGPLFSIVERKQLELNDPPIVKVASKAGIDSLFNKMLPYKPDFVKIWYISGKNYPAEESFPLVKYIAELCAKNDLKLAVHATQLKTAQLAVEAGANILVHSVEDEVIPDDFIKVLKSKDVTYVPTLIVRSNYQRTFAGRLTHHPQDLKWANAFAYGSLMDTEAMDTASLPRVIKWYRNNELQDSYFEPDSVMQVNLRKLFSTGVNVVTGTDAGNIGTLHASSYIRELEAMQDAGLTNAGILKASTINAASGYGLGDRLGTVETGKRADLLLLKSNPLDSLHHLNSLQAVIKDGKLIDVDTILSESPEAIVQRQINAYNARNVDAFAETFSEDVEIYNSEGNLKTKGRERLRKGYAKMFEKVPDLHCEIENRIVINNKVIDKEKVRVNGKYFHTVAIYEVVDGKIAKVRFLE
ncbi:putative steroid delta-isomerase domain protein [Fulvivirga imtechensis AK7]|uniref:Putative steroid delta-isomerase domain protein n=1 Tax=Fulvivirga imtechensis AK7 TaxID=1237149 RepID=L8JZD2_9BACT|nr:amidohydrolase family protein [Fulvivirga imtechensis]ELR73518.1 putative steroid delta-isomerase domain protein [Fulvivirga imtechensis AK7]